MTTTDVEPYQGHPGILHRIVRGSTQTSTGTAQPPASADGPVLGPPAADASPGNTTGADPKKSGSKYRRKNCKSITIEPGKWVENALELRLEQPWGGSVNVEIVTEDDLRLIFRAIARHLSVPGLVIKTLTGKEHLVLFATSQDQENFLADLDERLAPEGLTPLYVTSADKI